MGSTRSGLALEPAPRQKAPLALRPPRANDPMSQSPLPVIRLVCVDVDGTLVGASGTVPPSIWQRVDDLRARGVHFCLCSGRPAFGVTRGYAERLDPAGWHVFQNGASVVHLPSGESRSRPLPEPYVAALIARARTHGRLLELYGDTEYTVEQDHARTRAHAALLGLPFVPRPFEARTEVVVRAQWLLTPQTLDPVLAEPHFDLEVVPSTSPVMPDTIFVNLTAQGVNKGTGIEIVAQALQIPLAEVMMIGDAGNDLPALARVGHPVAMGNGSPAVKAAARTVVGDVDDLGLLEALALVTPP